MTSIFKSIVKNALFLLAAIFVLAVPAICDEQIFYSIHFATLNNLTDVNKQINSLKEKGKMVFWEKTEAPNMKQFYRVYVGRYKDWDAAVTFRDKLKEAGVGGHLGIQWFSEKVAPPKIQGRDKSVAVHKPSYESPIFSASEKNRFVDNQDGTITDTKTKLMWVKNGWRIEFISAETWFDAIEKCSKFSHGNYSDWRLPTLEEWNGVIDKENQNPALVAPNPFENIISHMPYWTQTEFIYSQDYTCNKICPLETYTVLLYSGIIQHQKKSDRAFIMPVRSVETQKSHQKYSNIGRPSHLD